MTFRVNLEQGTSLYIIDELISYGFSGCLYAGEVCLQELIENTVIIVRSQYF